MYRWALILFWLCVGCDPRPCGGRCDAVEVAARVAGVGAIDCGLVLVGEDRAALDACMSGAFEAGRPFFGVVELSVTTTDAILLRGYARNAEGVLREIVGTRQGTRTLVHTRFCFSAVSGPTLRCTEPMDGLFIECDCTTGDGDSGNPPG